MTHRKPIAICTAMADDEAATAVLCALGSDGTIWKMKNGNWAPVRPLPQPGSLIEQFWGATKIRTRTGSNIDVVAQMARDETRRTHKAHAFDWMDKRYLCLPGDPNTLIDVDGGAA